MGESAPHSQEGRKVGSEEGTAKRGRGGGGRREEVSLRDTGWTGRRDGGLAGGSPGGVAARPADLSSPPTSHLPTPVHPRARPTSARPLLTRRKGGRSETRKERAGKRGRKKGERGRWETGGSVAARHGLTGRRDGGLAGGSPGGVAARPAALSSPPPSHLPCIPGPPDLGSVAPHSQEGRKVGNEEGEGGKKGGEGEVGDGRKCRCATRADWAAGWWAGRRVAGGVAARPADLSSPPLPSPCIPPAPPDLGSAAPHSQEGRKVGNEEGEGGKKGERRRWETGGSVAARHGLTGRRDGGLAGGSPGGVAARPADLSSPPPSHLPASPPAPPDLGSVAPHSQEGRKVRNEEGEGGKMGERGRWETGGSVAARHGLDWAAGRWVGRRVAGWRRGSASCSLLASHLPRRTSHLPEFGAADRCAEGRRAGRAPASHRGVPPSARSSLPTFLASREWGPRVRWGRGRAGG